MPSTASSLSSTAVMSKTPSPSFVSWVSIAETAASGPTTAMVTSSGSAVTAGHEKASTITAMIAVNPVAMASVRRIGVCGRSAPDGDSVVVSDMRSLPSNLCSKNECSFSFFIARQGLENEHSFLEYNGVMPKVTDAHRAARRDEILDAAQRVFARKGYRGSSITAIIDESGLSAGAIYSYFESKHELFHAVVERTLAMRTLQIATDAGEQPRSPGELIRSVLVSMQGQPILTMAPQIWAVPGFILQRLTVTDFDEEKYLDALVDAFRG